ncbi:MAG TPA: toll/interleukin-1 receptor domain-containing protein, partial [Steroidobacteraceae bacterium]|nr:toll/interleukin-1 receptor domain-containing protein [Steroidobacteraceae bacterium]
MAGIFISYRRDDASGHAGRLFDRLAARFGRDRVFMDVTDIAPGEDFAHAIETSVGSAELLLAVIGPQWIGAVNDRGLRRIDESTDFVHQEIAAGFHHKLRVIPVLVRGARMPREDELPESLKSLARRQAVELTDARWESDVALFEQALAERLAGPGGTPPVDDRPRAFGKRGIVAAIAIALVVGGMAYFWRARPGDGHEPATPAVPPGQGVSDTDRPEIKPGRLKVATAHRALRLPSVARFKLAGQQFEILGLRTEPAANQDLLTIRLRMTNNGPYADAFTNVAAVLEVGDELIPAAAPIFDLIPGYAAKEGELQFPLAGPTQDAT